MVRRFFARTYWVDIILLVLRFVIIALVIIGAANTILSGKYTPSQWLSLTVSGLAQGSIYALIALGYTLVYGILLMINFAHGEVYMAGAFTAYFVADAFASRRRMFRDSEPLDREAIDVLFHRIGHLHNL